MYSCMLVSCVPSVNYVSICIGRKSCHIHWYALITYIYNNFISSVCCHHLDLQTSSVVTYWRFPPYSSKYHGKQLHPPFSGELQQVILDTGEFKVELRPQLGKHQRVCYNLNIQVLHNPEKYQYLLSLAPLNTQVLHRGHELVLNCTC